MVDVIVVGGGIAGMTASLNVLRAGKSCMILEQNNVGGQIALSPRVENYPSVKAISGSELSDKIFDQVTGLGAMFELESCLGITQGKDGFMVKTDYNEYLCKSVILATGVHHKKLNLPNEDNLSGKGLSYCALCDGAFFADKEVALVGDGNTALQYGILLSNYCSKVYVLTWFDKFFGDDALVKILRSRPNVEIMPNTSIIGVNGEEELRSLSVMRKLDGTEFELAVSGAFIAIGQVPDNKAFADVVELDKYGYIVATEDCKTSCDGIFVAGDCRTKSVRQLTTAMADGAIAGLNSCEFIDKL